LATTLPLGAAVDVMITYDLLLAAAASAYEIAYGRSLLTPAMGEWLACTYARLM
jgi:hypothetical protein